jgi:alkanesulfonate monooxygenase SsuD/methylene tetrahydromethanopterin reductase-like flavin-dependent oxidoreductase (luciferase family)
MKRTAKLADGWMPVGMTIEQLKSTSTQLRNIVKEVGRDPANVKVVARYNFAITPQPQGKDRAFFSGTLAQIKEDVTAIKAYGPDELILDSTFSPDTHTEQDFLRNMEEIRKIL